jgi:hypothetical protein
MSFFTLTPSSLARQFKIYFFNPVNFFVLSGFLLIFLFGFILTNPKNKIKHFINKNCSSFFSALFLGQSHGMQTVL